MSESEVWNNLSLAVERLKVTQEHTALALDKMSASLDRLVERLDQSDKLARRAEDRSELAHLRLDELREEVRRIDKHFDGEVIAANRKIDEEIDKFGIRIEKQANERKLDRRWLIGTTLTSVALLIALVTLVLRTVGL